jgi:hypothetical protein
MTGVWRNASGVCYERWRIVAYAGVKVAYAALV